MNEFFYRGKCVLSSIAGNKMFFSEEKRKFFEKYTANSVNSCLLAPVWSFPGRAFQLWCVSVFLSTGNCHLRITIFGETVEGLFTGSKGSQSRDMNSAEDVLHLQAPCSFWAFDFQVWWTLNQQRGEFVWDLRTAHQKATAAAVTSGEEAEMEHSHWSMDLRKQKMTCGCCHKFHVLDLPLIKPGCKLCVKPDGAF